jgi:hypothetical protein
VLNPETSSDSDSLKSKGARCVSAKVQIIQTGIKIRKKKEENTLKERIEKDMIIIINKTIRVEKTDS